MSKNVLQKLAVTAAGTVASVAVMGGLTPAAQAATFTYNGAFNVTSNSFGSLIDGTFDFDKTELPNGLFGYKVTSYDVNVAPSLAPLLTALTGTSEPLSALNAAIVAFYPGFPYAGIVPNILSGAPYDYIGDGGFPPSDPFNYTYSFTGAQVAALPLPGTLQQPLQALFAGGGSASLSVSSAAAVPEPATMTGIALAGAGLAAARRRKQKKAA